ncbi:MAG: VanW family protein [Firmicutes bacterium]|nr:VanW family protein [Bacillota bacterium]
MGRTKKRNSRSRYLKRRAVIAIAAFFAVFVAVAAIENNTVKGWDDLIYPGVTVDGTDLSGLNKEQAAEILAKNHGDVISDKKINITVEGKTFTLEYSKINPSYDIESAVEEAYAYGKDRSLFGKFNAIKFSGDKKIGLKLAYNQEAVSGFIASIESEVNIQPVNAKIDVNSGFKITQEKDGKQLDREALEKELQSKIDGKIGSDTDVSAAMKVSKAGVTADMLKGINAKISTFSTNYGSISSAARANNVVVATRSINGMVLMPGETFSFNGVVGQRTEARGFQAAPVIVGNKVESGLGGGICQVSSTLYNACLKGNLKIVERVHHTFPSSYVPIGQDATVDYGNIDFRFTNSYSYPLYIEGTTGGGYVSFSIYSDKSLAATTCAITNEVYETIQPTTNYTDDATLLAGTEVTETPAHTGYRVKVYRTVYSDGKQVSQETVSNDYYKVVNAVVKRGTMVDPATQIVADPAATPTVTPETPGTTAENTAGSNGTSGGTL